ncbi:hypothetical protein H6G17_25720 [Chroococcidiopsis sp. FACHB-1243]|uniref:ribbon-helix-helix domain-containing protein n=1 Tax=Chroococcidiopsis sp. [FACHB-1243] TaxID=2692781 RepID=UPI001784B35B|nr:ribbon-helix-helix protein, CopG family [Chroococcidiopsis sp. [FACHB-1243]]MBD2308870.1 hypothetical protein [Chroococcidiopsis sp. [FACHB-1243]]MBE9017117.1 hypothetical protein [Chroococcidiopsidales cyanobacterium LEGE 13417]
MATDKKKLSVYVDESLRKEIETLAKVESRSISNLFEALAQEAIRKARKEGRM